jgi:hypothetical protein
LNEVFSIPGLKANQELLFHGVDVQLEILDVDFEVFHFIVVLSILLLEVFALPQEVKLLLIDDLFPIVLSISKLFFDGQVLFLSFSVQKVLNSVDLLLVSVDRLSDYFDLSPFLLDLFSVQNNAVFHVFALSFDLILSESGLFRNSCPFLRRTSFLRLFSFFSLSY